MPQALLPMIPDGATQISDLISVVRQDKQWTYFCGVQPVFQHPEGDRRSFRMFTAQLCCQGVCTQAQILRTFGVSKNSVLRSVAKYRQEGIEARSLVRDLLRSDADIYPDQAAGVLAVRLHTLANPARTAPSNISWIT